MIESAAAVERAHEGTAKTRRDLEASQRKAASDAVRKSKALEKAELEWNDWTTQWGGALHALQLPIISAPEAAEPKFIPCSLHLHGAVSLAAFPNFAIGWPF